jgi:hypothetical protein
LIAGAQPDLAEQSGDLTKQAAMGGVLISTALVAGVSAFFALNDTLHLSWPAALGAALVWAFVILNLDRMLIVSMNGMHGIKLKLTAALPRLVLAIVIGAVVSTPLTLRVFQPEIDAQLQIMHAQQITNSDKTLNTTYADIPGLENQVANLQAIISGKTRPAVADDQDVKAAQAAYDTAEQTYQTAESQAQCELNGTCGSNHAGNGQAYQNQQATANADKQAADAANKALQAAETKASSNLSATAAQQVADARKQLPDVQNRLTVEQAEKQAADQAALFADNANSGLLSRLEALDTITADHPTAAIAHLMLFLLFLFIEVLPVLVKLLSTLGSPSAYDDLIAQQEEHVKQAKRSTLDAERKRQEAQAEAAAEVAAHQLAEQVEQAKIAAGQVVAMQAEIAMRSMEAWKELAKKKVDAELNQWIMANSAHLRQPNHRPVPVRQSAAWDPDKTVELPRGDLRTFRPDLPNNPS